MAHIAVLCTLAAVGILLRCVHAAVLFKQPPINPLDTIYPRIASPNYNWRPAGERVDCIVLHATAQDSLQQTVDTFLNAQTKRSAHFVVDRDGSVIQMVPVEARAWHAGVSALDGVAGVNDYSIGIEMVNRDDGVDPYTDAQYRAVARLIVQIRALYFVPDSRIVSHASVALPPGRKDDPRGFDFDRLHAVISTLPQETPIHLMALSHHSSASR